MWTRCWDEVDLDAVLDQVDIDRLLDRIDMDRLLGRMDLNDIVRRLDVDALIRQTDLGAVIAASSSGAAADVLDVVRRCATSCPSNQGRRPTGTGSCGSCGWYAAPCGS
jgi:hypothetical protein